ncbi:hypothetical protein FHX37_4213 [Haloactinospora alba]|uniref:Uncharacterized protein n=1 Tax=Haloactinospora alba TaxID=405555 RepID=A0A543N6N8_9ACTN|nr:hypothetical protein FHX37_4213 [Haloactinospora alba]
MRETKKLAERLEAERARPVPPPSPRNESAATARLSLLRSEGHDESPRDPVSAVRAWLHDWLCQSGPYCHGDNDHARGTVTATHARRIVDTCAAWGVGQELRTAVHDAFCRPGKRCPRRSDHARGNDATHLMMEVAELIESTEDE